MKKVTIATIVIVITLIFINVSCKSSPSSSSSSPSTPSQQPSQPSQPAEPVQQTQPSQPVQPSQPEQPVTAPSQPSLFEIRAREARQRAIDFDCPVYFPDDWRVVEEEYAAVVNMSESAAAEANEVNGRFNAVADAYDEIFQKTIPLYARAKEDEINAARDKLIDTGFARIVPDFMSDTDELALSALEQYEDGDYYKAKETADAALGEYETLLTGANAYLVRQEIINRGFAEHDPDNFDLADETAQNAIDKYAAGDKAAAAKDANDALQLFNSVLKNGWIAIVDERRHAASVERELALAEKADIAVREDFIAADRVYNQAEQDYRTEKFDTASISFNTADELFREARFETAIKRQAALEAIKMAEQKIEESDETAAEAERIIEGVSI